ncbi:MAG: DUF3160 domain-containing protein [bacterium]
MISRPTNRSSLIPWGTRIATRIAPLALSALFGGSACRVAQPLDLSLAVKEQGLRLPPPTRARTAPAKRATSVAAMRAAQPTAAQPTAAQPTAPRDPQRLVSATYSALFRKQRGLTYETLRRRHRHTYLAKHGLNIAKARYYRKFRTAFGLSKGARRVLREQGFVVVPGKPRYGWKPDDDMREDRSVNTGEGPANIFYRVFEADLPVFVSADSILHAWHRSFDDLVGEVERRVMRGVLAKLLKQTMEKLDRTQRAGHDAYAYLAVAHRLLRPKWWPPRQINRETQPIRKAIARYRPKRVLLMGEWRNIDFSRFLPRGRYGKGWALRPYFKAITWLGRAGLTLEDRNPVGRRNPREEEAARAIVRAMQASGSLPLYKQLEQFYSVIAGPPVQLTPTRLLALCARAGKPQCEEHGAAYAKHYRALPSPVYSAQLDGRDRATVRVSFFPQRFSYDAFLTTRLTTPVLPPLARFGRSMARDLDVAFLLGSDRALDHYAAEMARPHREHLPAALEAARRTLQKVKPTRLGGSVYNHWLEALMALAKTNVSKTLPAVLRTARWQDRKLESVLGSWTELRHDVGQVIMPSTGGGGCQYPKGYVEPVPALYESLSRAAARFAKAFPASGSTRRVHRFLAFFQATMKKLAHLARLELAGRTMSKSELAFLKNTVDAHIFAYSAIRRYDGWYPKLFWSKAWRRKLQRRPHGVGGHSGGSLSQVAVADVHTDVDRGQVLQVGVGHPGVMVVAINAGGKTALYGGPVYNYYSLQQPQRKRLTDARWRRRVIRSKLPPRPAFTRAYHVDR